MNEVKALSWNFKLIPEVEEANFISGVQNYWYEWNDHLIPRVSSDMIYDCHHTKELYFDYVAEIHEYYYARDEMKTFFDPNKFPVNKDLWEDEDWDNSIETWSEHAYLYILKFAHDLKMVLDMNHMCYEFLDEDGNTLINQPIKEVW